MFFFSAVLVFCAFFVPFNGNKQAAALSDAGVNAAYKIGAKGDGTTLTDLYNKDKDNFNAACLIELYKKTTGKTKIADVKQYITDNGIDEYGSKVLKAKFMNETSGNYGIIVQLGGINWIVTSLTLDTDGNVVATLLRATATQRAQFNDEDNTPNTADEPSHMYSTSTIRNTVKEMLPVPDKYLVKPKNIEYQMQQHYRELNGASRDGFYAWISSPNDSLKPNNPPYTVFIDGYDYTTKPRYAEWGDDYVWLPSFLETGGEGNGAVGNNGIWGLTGEQISLQPSGASTAWLRTAISANGTDSYKLAFYTRSDTSESNWNYTNVTKLCGIRPALHLNISVSNGSGGITEPSASVTEQTYLAKTDRTFSLNNIDKEFMTVKGVTSDVEDKTSFSVSEDGVLTAEYAGKYTVTVELNDQTYKWKNGGTDKKEYVFTIKKAKPNVTATIVDIDTLPDPLYPTYNGGKLPAITNTDSNPTLGELMWDEGQKPSATVSEYTWTFTPKDTKNYETLTGTINIVYKNPPFKAVKIEPLTASATIYDSYGLEKLKEFFKVYAVYQDDSKRQLADSEYEFIITSPSGNSSLVEGANKIIASITSGSETGKESADYEITVLKSQITSLRAIIKSDAVFTYPVTAEDIIKQLDITVKWNYAPDTSVALEDTSKIKLTGVITAGTPELTVGYDGVDGVTATIKPNIGKGTFDLSGITLSGDTVTYDEGAHKIEIAGTLPDGVTATYLYENADKSYSKADPPTDAGVYTVTVSFTHENPNYNAITDKKTATLTIDQANYPDADKIKFEGKTVSLGTHSLVAKNVPDGITVTYVYNGGEPQSEPIEFSEVNETGYEITAIFTHTNPNYKDIEDKTATLIITEKKIYDTTDLSVTGEGVTVEGKTLTAKYNGSAFVISVAGKVKDEDGKEVAPVNAPVFDILQGENKVEAAINAGSYTVIVKYEMPTDGIYADYLSKFEDTYTLTIAKADFDLSGIKFESKSFPYDGEAHSIEITGTLPEWLTVTYEGNEQTEAGTYTVTAKFTHSNPNYNDIANVTATLTIGAGEYKPEFTFDNKTVEYNGTAQSIEITGEIPEWLTVTYEGDGTEPGEYTVTAKFSHENAKYGAVADMTAKLTITKAKVSVPKYTGNLTYTGAGIVPKSSDFESFDANVMKLEPTSGTNAGENYKAKFTLLDTDHYEWADGKNESDWTIGKAKLGATKTAGRLPEFTSDSYKGGIDGVVKYKYYTDASCTEEVHPDDLVAGTEYYVKAELSDSTNFEFAESAFTFSEVGFEHTIGEPTEESGSSSKIWIWIVIAVVAVLLLLTLIIVLSRRRAHAGYDDEYDQDYDYDDEDEDDEEDEDEEYEDDDE